MQIKISPTNHRKSMATAAVASLIENDVRNIATHDTQCEHGQEILPAFNREAAVGSYLMLNDVANEPSMSSNDVKTVVSTNHEMASRNSLVEEPLKKEKYTEEETTLITSQQNRHLQV